MAKFDPSTVNKGLYKVELRYWNHVVEEGCKVFVPGLSRANDESKIRAIFETYGDITDLTLAPSKVSTVCNATITYSKM